jgi:iron complex outermembrane receptor protein
VTDENGQALPYSNVVDKATANGVTTDGNGEIRVTGLPVTLIAKYVGFQNKSIEVTNAAATIVFKLDPNNSLDEVVVTGNRSKVQAYLTQLFLLISCMLKTLSLVAR